MAKGTTTVSASDGDTGATGLYDITGTQEVDLSSINEIPVKLTVVLGKTRMTIGQLLALENGNIIELERKIGEAVDVLVNGRLIAKGEIVIVEENVGITLTEIIKKEQQ